MDDPILEALTFDLESDLSLPETILGAAAAANAEGPSRAAPKLVKLSKLRPAYSSKRVLYNSLVLTPCLFPTCEFITCEPLVDTRGRKHYEELTNHLMAQHGFVISDIEAIANLHRSV